MELAGLLVLMFIIAIAAVVILIPVLMISKVMQLIVKSFKKLFYTVNPKG